MATPDLSDIEKSKNPAIRALFVCVRQALSQTNINVVMRTVAAALWQYRRKQFKIAHGVKETLPEAYVVLPSVLAGDRPEEAEPLQLGLDHRTLWNKNGKPYLLTAEPYYITKQQLKELIQHCDEHDIDFQIDAESMYFPGHTIRLLFKKNFVSSYDAVGHKNTQVE